MLFRTLLFLFTAASVGADVRTNLFAQAHRASWRAVKVNAFVQGGKTSFTQDGVLQLGSGQPGTGVRWTKALPRVDYELSFAARRTEGFDFFCGLTFPVAQQYLTLVLGGWDGETCGLSNIDGLNASENETSFSVPFKQKQWRQVRLRVSEERIRVWLDKKPVVDFKPAGKRLSLHPAMEPMRPFGLASWFTGAEIKDLALRNLD